jgi:hypothetical protein
MAPPSPVTCFRAPWGRVVQVVSVLATGLLVAVPAIAWLSIPPGHALARVPAVVLPLAILAGTSLFCVRGYQVEGRCLIIRRLVWSTCIRLDGLESATVDPAAMDGSLRLAGNGGLFACTGLFRSRRLGTYRAFVTDLHRCVVLRCSARRPIVVSPDRPEEFAALLNRFPAKARGASD